MNNEINIWNILHDGEITAVEKGMNGFYTIFVNIPYLRRRIKPLGDSFVLTLLGVKQVAFQDFDGTISSLENELELSTPEILYTESTEMPVFIATTAGTLILNYESINFNLDTGQSVEFGIIEAICREYWDEWGKNKK